MSRLLATSKSSFQSKYKNATKLFIPYTCSLERSGHDNCFLNSSWNLEIGKNLKFLHWVKQSEQIWSKATNNK